MKSFVAFTLLGCISAQDESSGNFTQSMRSLLSPREGFSSTGAPKLSGKYCGWSQHGEDLHCRVTFSGGKAHIEWKKTGGHSSSKCKDGKSPDDHDCCLCGKDRNIDCSESYKVTEGGKLYSGLGVDLLSSGYDVHFNDNSCLKKAMGEDKKNPNGVPLRIKIHDEGHLDLIECKQQEDSFCDGGGVSCDMMSEHSSSRPDGCDGWDDHHKAPCRRRAGCKSRGLAVPSVDLEEDDEEFDDEEFDLDNVEVAQAFAHRPATKRGLVLSSCKYAKWFAPHARGWMYNYDVGLKDWDSDDWDTEECQQFAARSDFEFVPMIASLDSLTKFDGHMYSGSQRLLGMNEPNDKKNESAQLGAQRWKEYEAIADGFDVPLHLGTAAPGGMNLERGKKWLRDFFGACADLYGSAGCRVDFVAVHFYVCNGTTDETAEKGAEDMMTFLDDVYEEFQKPLWLTEFNCGDGDPTHNALANQTAANHLRFMKAALPKLEAAKHVERYSWYQTWQRNEWPTHLGANPGCALVNEEGTALTALGEFYSSYQYGREAEALV